MASVDTVDANKRFAAEHRAKFPLLCDMSRAVTKLYGVGVEYEGDLYSDRWTIYIDREGIVRKVDKDVKPSTAGSDMVKTFLELGFAKRP
jgi:peroxiredoxin Q/BCP